MEQGTYDKKKCMLYTSSIELEKDEKGIYQTYGLLSAGKDYD